MVRPRSGLAKAERGNLGVPLHVLPSLDCGSTVTDNPSLSKKRASVRLPHWPILDVVGKLLSLVTIVPITGEYTTEYHLSRGDRRTPTSLNDMLNQ